MWRRREWYEDEEFDEMVEDFTLCIALGISYQEVLNLTDKERMAAITAYNNMNKDSK